MLRYAYAGLKEYRLSFILLNKCFINLRFLRFTPGSILNMTEVSHLLMDGNAPVHSPLPLKDAIRLVRLSRGDPALAKFASGRKLLILCTSSNFTAPKPRPLYSGLPCCLQRAGERNLILDTHVPTETTKFNSAVHQCGTMADCLCLQLVFDQKQ